MFCVVAENKSIITPLGLKRIGRRSVGHDPVVEGFFGIFGSQIEFGNVGENSERFLLSGFEQLHAGVIFPCAQRVG